jgi:hypothetical protein
MTEEPEIKLMAIPCPDNLNLTKIEINAGRSSQATLLSRNEDKEMKTTTANKVLPKAGLNGSDWAFMQGSAFVLRLNYCANNPRLRQYPNRYYCEHFRKVHDQL